MVARRRSPDNRLRDRRSGACACGALRTPTPGFALRGLRASQRWPNATLGRLNPMSIKAIGPRPLATDPVENRGALPSAPQPRAPLHAPGVLGGLAARRRTLDKAEGATAAPRKPLAAVLKALQEKDQESAAVPVAGNITRPPVRSPRRRTAPHHHEPDPHDAPNAQLNSSSAEAVFQARQVVVGRAAPIAGLGAPDQVQQYQLPVDQARESDRTRFARPQDRRSHSLAALARLLGGPVLDPLRTHPQLYTAEAKAGLKQRMAEQGPAFRTSPEERDEFRRAFLFQAQSEVPAQLRAAQGELARQALDTLLDDVARLQREHPEVRHIPPEDLAALRAFTGPHRELVQDALQGEGVPAHPLGLSFAKAVVSALHALPAAYTHAGTVFTQSEAAANMTSATPGQTRTEWQFLAASQARATGSQTGHMAWQTQALDAKNIAPFSVRPQAQELLFPPGTRFETTGAAPGAADIGQPVLTVFQKQLPAHEPSATA